jgi:hypothetical protein
VRYNVADGTKRDVEIRLTKETWPDTIEVLSGATTAERAASAVMHELLRAEVDQRFLLWDDAGGNQLVLATSPELPVDVERQRLAAFVRSGERGEWFAVSDPNKPRRRRKGY